MKKRMYRAQWLEQVNIDMLNDLVRGQRITFGVDVAKEVFFGAFMNDKTDVLKIVKWTCPKDMRALVDFLTCLPASNIEVAMEASGTYGDAFYGLLKVANIPVFSVSPKRTKDACEVYDGVPSSHDAKAASIIGQLHIHRRSSPWPEKNEKEKQMSVATELMLLHDGQFGRNINRLEGKLARHWPELTSILELGSATLIRLVAEYGGPRKVAESPQTALKFIKTVAGPLLGEGKAEAVVASARSTIGAPMIDAEVRCLQQLAEETNRNRIEHKKAKAHVENLVGQDQELTTTSKVIGKATSAILVSKLGYAYNYQCADEYQKATGYNLKERSSGKHKGQLKITKRGSSLVRQHLFLAALRLIQKDWVCRAWYNKKVARDGGRLKMKAVIALTRKLIKALWWVGKGEEFDSTKLFDTRRLALEA